MNGYIPAIVSLFREDEIDIVGFEKYINWLMSKSIDGIVVCGSTGESICLNDSQKISLVNSAVQICKSASKKVIVGIIAADTCECIRQIKLMNNYDFDAYLCICPYYLKPSQSGIIKHFSALQICSDHPIIVYNNPSRVGANITVDTFAKLLEFPKIIGIKECMVESSRILELRNCSDRNFLLFTGNDEMAGAAFACGADGVISVVANIVPELCVQFYNAWLNHDMGKFYFLQNKLFLLSKLMFEEPSPAPLKYALSKILGSNPDVKLPFEQISVNLKEKIDAILCDMSVCVKW